MEGPCCEATRFNAFIGPDLPEAESSMPSYFAPGTGEPGGVGDGWAAMAAAAAKVPITAIFNPNSGPLPGPPSAAYAAAFTQLESAGGKVVAYVYTDRCVQPLRRYRFRVQHLSFQPDLV
jgi:hypothetical protein